jgi:hypothetical protein
VIACALAFAVLVLLSGCKTLQPGADPVVVRTEQSLTIAQATFDTFLKLDDADRPLVKHQLPAVHNFAEWLREPMPISPGSTVIVARWAEMVAAADRVKLAYQANRTPENRANLVTALATLEVAVSEVQSNLAQLQALNPQ